MSKSNEDRPPQGGLNFDLCGRNDMLAEKGVVPRSFLKTGTTIVGLKFQDGVILGAGTGAAEGLSQSNICCWGVGIIADAEAALGRVSANLRLHQYSTDREPRVVTALTYLKEHLSKFQGKLEAAFILGGVDFTGPHLHAIYPSGSTDALPYAAIGSGSPAAMTVFDSEYREGLTRDDGIVLVARALRSGILNDFATGGDGRFCVITRGQREDRRMPLLPDPQTDFREKTYSPPKKTEAISTKITLEEVEIVEEKITSLEEEKMEIAEEDHPMEE